MKNSHLIVVAVLALGLSSSSHAISPMRFVANFVACSAVAQSAFSSFLSASTAADFNSMAKLQGHELTDKLESARDLYAAGAASHAIAALFAFRAARSSQPIFSAILGVAFSNAGTLALAVAQSEFNWEGKDLRVGPIATLIQSVALIALAKTSS